VLRAWLQRVVFSRAWLTFALLVLSFLVFGAGTFNLFLLLKANIELIGEHGMQALADGAAQQFVELLGTAVLSMAAYVLFKACEHRLVRMLCEPRKSD
jgi:hypothetical protein